MLTLGRFPVAVLQQHGQRLNFSALTALPEGRRAAVTTAANAAAVTLGVTAQSIVDALSVGRGLASLLPSDGCLLATSGGAVTVQGDPVGAFRSWTGVELANQSNASQRPVSAALGVYADGANKILSLPGLVVGNLEAVAVIDNDTSTGMESFPLWTIGTAGNTWTPYLGNVFYDSFGTSTRIQSPGAVTAANDKGIYQPILTSGTLTLRWNGATLVSTSGLTPAIALAPRLFNPGQTVSAFYQGTLSAFALNLAAYSTAQRAAVRQFCKEYYGVTY